VRGHIETRHEVHVHDRPPVEVFVSDDDRASVSLDYGALVLVGRRADLRDFAQSLVDQLTAD
jgi:hypothetical protein